MGAVLAYPHAFPLLLSSLEAAVTNRLVQAEIAFRQGKSKGIEEQAIVDTFNLLVTKFGAPDFAATLVPQIRFLRISIARTEPNFMEPGVARPDAKVGEPINSNVSPIQAIHLIGLLIDQKLLNPAF